MIRLPLTLLFSRSLELMFWNAIQEDGVDDDEGLIFYLPPPPPSNSSDDAAKQEEGGEDGEKERDAAKQEDGGGDKETDSIKEPRGLCRDKFHRVKDVIDEILERRTADEAAVADLYESHMDAKRANDASKAMAAMAAAAAANTKKPPGAIAGAKPSPKDAVLPISRAARNRGASPAATATTKAKPHAPRPLPMALKSPNSASKAPNMLDDPWKEGGRNFPKRSSAIGNRFQVWKIPQAGTCEASASEQ